MRKKILRPMICGDLNGKEIQKKRRYMFVELIHFAIQQKLTQQYKATILQKKKQKNPDQILVTIENLGIVWFVFLFVENIYTLI